MVLKISHCILHYCSPELRQNLRHAPLLQTGPPVVLVYNIARHTLLFRGSDVAAFEEREEESPKKVEVVVVGMEVVTE